MADIKLSKLNGYDVVEFKKSYWSPDEILMAQCFGFKYDVELELITCIVCKTAKRPLFEFIKKSFKNFNESVLEKPRKVAFYEELKNVYTSLEKEVDSKIEITLPYSKDLFKHQTDVIKEAYYKKYNFLALQMGLGKTLTSASLSRLWQSQCTLIICPSAVKWNWYRDLVKFKYNELFFTILDASKKRSIKGFQERFVIVNYESLEKFMSYILHLPIEHIICDEAHGLKNISSYKFLNTSKIVKNFPNSKLTLLSGTPIKNRVDDMYAYLKLIKHRLGLKKEDFLIKYTTRVKFKITGGQNLDDLRIKTSNFMIRKTKEECLDLPDKIYLSYRYELDDYKKEYDKLIEELSEQKSHAAANGNIHALNNITAKSKVKGIIEIANSIIEQGRKVVIFGGYTEPLEMLESHFKDSCVKITGSVNSFDRDGLIQRFHNDPKCNVFLGNLIAAGVGINLTNASDVIFINFPFTDAEFQQGIDRCHRIGQKNSVNVHLTFCEESLDDYIFDIIQSKALDANKLIDNNSNDSVASASFTEILIKKIFKGKNNGMHDNLFVGTLQTAETQKSVNGDRKIQKVGRDLLPDTKPDETKIIEGKKSSFELPEFN